MTDAIYWGVYLKFEPGNGITGTSYDSGGAINAGVTSFEANAGKPMSCIRLGGTPGKWGNGTATGGVPNTTPFSVMQAAVDPIHAHGALPVSDWAPWDWALPSNNYALRLQAINAGTWDAYMTTWFTAAAAWGKALLLRPMWEENWFNQFPWQYHDNTGSWNIGTGLGWGGVAGWTNTKTDFINAWQRIVTIAQTTGAREGFGNGHIQFVWAPNRQTDTENAFSTLTPGDAFIDWYGWDSYPDGPDSSITDSSRGTGAMAYVRDIYAEMAALHPSKPFFIAESAWKADRGTVTPTSITSNGTVWTIVVPATAPGGNGWVFNNGVKLTGVTPSAYNGEVTINGVTGTGPWTITSNQTANPGTATVLGSAQLIDDIARDAAITYDLETGFPQQMPRVRGFTLFYDAGFSYIPEFSPDNANARNSLSWSSLKKHLNAHFLGGAQMAADTSTKLWVPYQDQAVISPYERHLALLRSTPSLEGLWVGNEAHLAATVADRSPKGRNATVNGDPGLGGPGVTPAEPGWTSPAWPGAAGNNWVIADQLAFSLANGPMSWEFSLLLPATPTTSFAIFSKYTTVGSLAEWLIGFYIGNPGLACAAYTNTGGIITAFNLLSWPSLGVPHHYIISHDPSLATNRWKARIDGAAPLTGGGTPAGAYTDTTTPVYIGQTPDAGKLWPIPAGVSTGVKSIYSAVLSDETAAEHYASWIAAPAILTGPTATVA